MMELFFQRLVRWSAYVPLRLYCWIRVQGKKQLPKGPCILVCNHASMMDPILMDVVLPGKHISFLCSRKLFACPRFCQAFLRWMGAIPLLQGVEGLAELKRRAEQADQNHIIGFFSQGAIFREQSTFKPGAAILAMQTGLPLVPVFIRYAPFFRGGSRLCFGKPLLVEVCHSLDKERVDAVTEEIRNRVYALADRDQK